MEHENKVIAFVKMLIKSRRSKAQLKKVLMKEYNLSGGGTSIELSLLLIAHSLEKGMSIPNPRIGFGMAKASTLLEYQMKYVQNRMREQSFAFDESVSILRAWIDYSVAQGIDVSEIKSRLDKMCAAINVSQFSAGRIQVEDVNEKIYDHIDFEPIAFFLTSRRSTRWFQQEPVSNEVMSRVIGLTSCAPSACNRQPCKVYWTNSKDVVREINRLIPGNKGFEEQVPNWAIITSDRLSFSGGEGLQWYVNGGIYLAYFILSLHVCSIGSCIFQTPISDGCVAQIKHIAGISNHEAVVAAVGFGYPLKDLSYAAAQRRPEADVLIRF